MRIFLVRHGDADAEIPEGLGDEARTLTTKARQAVMAHFQGLMERIGPIQLVITSPLARTVQTAQLFSLSVKHEGLLRTHRSLLPDMPVGSIEALLTDHVGENVAVVGHQPSMGAMAAHLLGLQSFPKPVNPGTVIGLEREDGAKPDSPARLLFYACPGQPVLEAIER